MPESLLGPRPESPPSNPDDRSATSEEKQHIVDSDERARALRCDESFIVQAPAGSGKTQLLTLRFLALLPRVAEPEQVLAITFTRAATAEMRQRVLSALKAAEEQQLAEGESTPDLELARAALAHSKQRGWQLLEQPHRLNIQTIDSLALSIAHRAPLLSRLGGQLSPTEDAAPLHREAARRTLELLGSEGAVSDALGAVLRHRDTSLSDCESLIANMLRERDQWLDPFPLGTMDDAAWAHTLAALEAPFVREHARLLALLRSLLTEEEARELLALANYACGQQPDINLATLRGLSSLDQLTEAAHWECACQLLLTREKSWRQRISIELGFPPQQRTEKQRLQSLIRQLSDRPGLLDALCELRTLPPPRFSPEQGALLRHIFTMLLRAVAELRVVFAERSQVDFAEVGLAARAALREAEAGSARLDDIRHLLIDEFQDTSRPQRELLQLLMAEWVPGEGRTCFVVGDPMQSIYLFRQAEVQLFAEAQHKGLQTGGGAHFHLHPLTLSMNFRSDRGVVSPLNTLFSTIFEATQSSAGTHIPFAPATPGRAGGTEDAVHVHCDFIRRKVSPNHPFSAAQARMREAKAVLALVQQRQPRMQGSTETLAILVRARAHLSLIAQGLRAAGIPFRSVEIDTLRERQEVLDLLSLLRALTHPMDRIAWLAVLRAPWCGLTLADLHTLCGDETKQERGQPLLPLLSERANLLERDARLRLEHTLGVLHRALTQRAQGRFAADPAGLAAWLEATWELLGGPHCVDAEGLGNTRAFFSMLAELSPDGLAIHTDELDRRLDRLFARPDPAASDRHGVQLMTIHKAKGLGFDTVIVPGLERSSGVNDPELLSWMLRTQPETGAPELLLAPIGRKRGGKDRHYSWVLKQKQNSARDEAKRLLYVACSRAAHELHLFGAAIVPGGAEESEESEVPRLSAEWNTLLHTGWPALKPRFESAWRERRLPQASNSPGESLAQAEWDGASQSSPARPLARVLGFPSDDPDARNGTPDHGVLERVAAEALPSSASGGQRIWRLPTDWIETEVIAESARNNTAPLPVATSSSRAGNFGRAAATSAAPFRRPRQLATGHSQLRGTVTHALLEGLTRSVATQGVPTARIAEHFHRERARWSSAAEALLRQGGLASESLRAQVLQWVIAAVTSTVEDEVGRWLLSSHRGATVELQLSSGSGGTLRTARPDRVFFAGEAPSLLPLFDEQSTDFLWIVDYKTSTPAPGQSRLSFLEAEWERHAPQLQRYGAMLRAQYPDKHQRLSLFFPGLPHLDWRPEPSA